MKFISDLKELEGKVFSTFEECKEAEKQIPDFIGKNMDYLALKDFAEQNLYT